MLDDGRCHLLFMVDSALVLLINYYYFTDHLNMHHSEKTSTNLRARYSIKTLEQTKDYTSLNSRLACALFSIFLSPTVSQRLLLNGRYQIKCFRTAVCSAIVKSIVTEVLKVILYNVFSCWNIFFHQLVTLR